MANVITNDTKFGIALSVENKDQRLVRGILPMQIMPNFYSEFWLSLINNFRFLLLYCIFLMACKYFIHIFLVVIFVF